MSDRPLDLVLFGATGFVGRLTAAHVAEHAPKGLRVGLAGRSEGRLAALRDDLGPAASAWEIRRVDAADADALAALAAGTAVVATSVGPYLRYGMPLAAACARAGTDYADITGEVLFVRRTADGLDDLAARTGARIVHACGFDSVPSDLGVLVAHERAQADGTGDLTDTTLLVRAMKGGLSGGTVDSVRTIVDEARSDRAVRRLLADPYALSPDRRAEPDGGERDQVLPSRDAHLGVWTAPFVMASFNTRIVRRSNALLDFAYGRGFRYRETMGVGRGPVAPLKAAAVSGALGAGFAGMALRPVRAVLDRVLPDPGEGPDEQTQRAGFFRIEIHTRTTGGARYRVVVAAQGDPGHGATSLMFGEAALCLAAERDRLPRRGGVLTPATGIGMPLVDRLRAAGMTLDIERL